MGLSEREQKLFEQLERELSGDAQFTSKVNSAQPKPANRGRMLVVGVLLMLVGIALLIFAVMLRVAFFGIVAFVVMLIGLVLASSNFDLGPTAANEQASKPTKPKGGNFFEDRWDRRFGE